MEKTPNSKEGWNTVQWATVEQYVRKLQKRIYSASKEGKIEQIRKLQNTLTKSYSAKLLATRRVTQDNRGKKTAGIDGIKLLNPQLRLKLAKDTKIKTFSRPLRRKPGKAEKRPLGIPPIADRVNQALLKLALEPEWEAKFEANSYGFRPGKNCYDAIKQIFISIKSKPKYVLDANISKCFDKIDHPRLLEKLALKGKFHRQIKAWLKSGILDNHVFKDTDLDTPQGGVISPLLANIALHGMETMLKELMKDIPLRTPRGTSMGLRDKQRSLSVIRYVDDFVVMHYDKAVVIKCKQAIQEWLKNVGLELSEEKTRITHTLELTEQEQVEFQVNKPGFDFLGFTIRQYPSKDGRGQIGGFKTLILPSAKKCKQHQEKLALIIRKSSILSQGDLIQKLNPVIRSWTRDFGVSHGITCKTLNKMDYLLYLKLRRWSKRKTKSAAKGFLKYWRRINNRWVFADEQGVKLYNHTDYSNSIKTYEKTEGESSPFHGNETYWAI